jgi:hypothetical protein
MHNSKYPEYKYKPDKHQDKNTEKEILLNNKIDNIDLPMPILDSMDLDPIPFDDNDMIIDEKLHSELNELFNFDIYNIQNLYNQNYNSILNQQGILSDFNSYDLLLDPILFKH